METNVKTLLSIAFIVALATYDVVADRVNFMELQAIENRGVKFQNLDDMMKMASACSGTSLRRCRKKIERCICDLPDYADIMDE